MQNGAACADLVECNYDSITWQIVEGHVQSKREEGVLGDLSC